MTGTLISKLMGAMGPYGFVRGEDGVDRIVVPSALAGVDEISRVDQIAAFEKLKLNSVVYFDHVPSGKGPRAVNVATVPNLNIDLDE